MYVESFSGRHLSNSATFTAVVQRGRNTENLSAERGRDGSPRCPHRTVTAEKQIRNTVDEILHVSMKQIARLECLNQHCGTVISLSCTSCPSISASGLYVTG